MKFYDKISTAAKTNDSWLCVGLDPEISKIPTVFGNDIESIYNFNEAIIDATSDLVCAYKPNAAFYEVHGSAGWDVLQKTIRAIPKHIPVILDFKRGDIGNTAKMYARSAFEHLGADAVTVSPYLGFDSISPFIEYEEKGVFILCLTSNPSSADFQKLQLSGEMLPLNQKSSNGKATNLYQYIAAQSLKWNAKSNIGLVVGATAPEELNEVRNSIGNIMPILIPGVGSQGGDLEKAVMNGSNHNGDLAIINVARAVIFPDAYNLSISQPDYEKIMAVAAAQFRDRINKTIDVKKLI